MLIIVGVSKIRTLLPSKYIFIIRKHLNLPIFHSDLIFQKLSYELLTPYNDYFILKF